MTAIKQEQPAAQETPARKFETAAAWTPETEMWKLAPETIEISDKGENIKI